MFWLGLAVGAIVVTPSIAVGVWLLWTWLSEWLEDQCQTRVNDRMLVWTKRFEEDHHKLRQENRRIKERVDEFFSCAGFKSETET